MTNNEIIKELTSLLDSLANQRGDLYILLEQIRKFKNEVKYIIASPLVSPKQADSLLRIRQQIQGDTVVQEGLLNKIKDFDLDIKKIDQRFYNITGKNILSVVNKSPLNVSPKTKRRNFI